MDKDTIIAMANGNYSMLRGWWGMKNSYIPFKIFLYWFQSNLELKLTSWEINTVYDKQGQIIKHY